MKLATKAIHAGYTPDHGIGAVMPPIYQTSIFAHETLEGAQDYRYSRVSNPTRATLEANVAALENAQHGFAFGSGLAAIDAVLRVSIRPGERVVAQMDLYGGAYRLLTQFYAAQGVDVQFVDLRDPAHLAEHLTPNTRLLWLESPSNPLLNLVDIPALCRVAHAAGVSVAIDNTFATPCLQNPLDLGCDWVVHSATKYLAGHSDVVLGVAVCNDPEHASALKRVQSTTGNIPGPQDCFLTLRGIKTLPLRMERHCANAAHIAHWLSDHSAVAQVYYPGLPTHPQHALAQRQMRAFGGIVTITLQQDTRHAAAQVAEGLNLFTLAESLGGVESIVNHSASMSHGSMPTEVKAQCGIRDSMLRLSLGIEDVDDLQADLAQALQRVV